MNKLVVVGDIHLSEKEPKRSQGIMFLDWLFNQPLNNKDNDLLLLGDLCNINSKPELFGIYVNYFVNKSKFRKIKIINGNHDTEMQDTILSIFEPLQNVEIILDPTTDVLGNLKLIYLPHYNHQGTNKKSMIERYSNLHTEEEFSGKFDFGFGHIEDDTQHFSKNYPNTSNLIVGQWMNGHVHTETITSGGNYLGSATLNSSSESGKTSYIAVIDEDDKKYELVSVPKFLEYYEVTYPNNLEKINTPLGLWLVKDSLDKNETLHFYEEQAKSMGFDFYTRLIKNKRSELKKETAEKSDNKSVEEYLNDFIEINKIDSKIADICKEVLKAKVGENA